MAKSDITAERLRELLHYDPVSGVFTWRENAMPADIKHGPGYSGVTIDGKPHLSHRLAWLYMTGEWPRHEIDHQDRAKRNNAWDNLRDVTRSTNAQNRQVKRGSASGYLGVQRNRNRWQACIALEGRVRISLGTRDTPEEAYALYLAAKRQLHTGNTL